jgi:maleylacetate reductase
VSAFTWSDGDRLIRFGPGAGEHAWPGADLLSTPRARATIPAALRDGWRSVQDVPAGQVTEIAAALVEEVGDGPVVAWGGGRVIDTAKAVAAARGGRVCAVPTTLSGAEMTGGHRAVPGFEDRGRHRPVLVLADPALMTGQPEPDRRGGGVYAPPPPPPAHAHAAEALYGQGRNPVSSMAAAAAATDIAAGLEEHDLDARERLARGSILAAYAMDSAGYSLHHVLCQTIVRTCGTPHAATNATMLPHVLAVMRPREQDAMAELAAALGVAAGDLPDRVSALAELGVSADDLGGVADAALQRPELARLQPPPDREELLSLLRSASPG